MAVSPERRRALTRSVPVAAIATAVKKLLVFTLTVAMPPLAVPVALPACIVPLVCAVAVTALAVAVAVAVAGPVCVIIPLVCAVAMPALAAPVATLVLIEPVSGRAVHAKPVTAAVHAFAQFAAVTAMPSSAPCCCGRCGRGDCASPQARMRVRTGRRRGTAARGGAHVLAAPSNTCAGTGGTALAATGALR
jgi:hypothetical protein